MLGLINEIIKKMGIWDLNKVNFNYIVQIIKPIPLSCNQICRKYLKIYYYSHQILTSHVFLAATETLPCC